MGAILSQQVGSQSEESPCLIVGECQNIAEHIPELPEFVSCRAFKLYIQGGRDTPQDFDFFLTYNLNAATA